MSQHKGRKRELTPEEEANQAIALEMLAILEEDLKQRIPHARAAIFVERIRKDALKSPETIAMLVDKSKQSEEDKTNAIKAWSSWIEDEWNLILAQHIEATSHPPKREPSSASDYFVHNSEEFVILMRSLCDGSTGNYWNTNHQALTRTYVLPDLNNHYVQLGLTEQERDDGIGVEMLERLTFRQDADAAFAVLYVSRLLAPPAPLPMNTAPVGWVDLDDVMEKIGWIPRSTAERQKMRGHIWDYLRFGARAGVYGKRSSTYRDKDTGELIPTEVDGPIWSFHERERPVQPSLLETYEVPLRVEIVMTRTWTSLVTDPRTVQYFPLGERLGNIPGNQPSGAWARCLGMALANLWWQQPRLALSGEICPTRRYLLTRYTPKKSPPMEVLCGNTPKRAREYWLQALKLLVSTGFLAPNEETVLQDAEWKEREEQLPRYEWQDAWLDERVLLQPGPAIHQAVLDASNALLPAMPHPLSVVKRGRGRPLGSKNKQ